MGDCHHVIHHPRMPREREQIREAVRYARPIGGLRALPAADQQADVGMDTCRRRQGAGADVAELTEVAGAGLDEEGVAFDRDADGDDVVESTRRRPARPLGSPDHPHMGWSVGPRLPDALEVLPTPVGCAGQWPGLIRPRLGCGLCMGDERRASKPKRNSRRTVYGPRGPGLWSERSCPLPLSGVLCVRLSSG
jgi:hypothetical protein